MSHNQRLSSTSSSTQNLDLRIFVKDVHDTQGRKRPLTVKPWASIKDVKDQLTKHLHIPASSQCIYFGPLLSSAKELPNHRTLQDAGIYRNGETLLLEIKGNYNTLQGSVVSVSGSLLNKKSSSHPSISSLRNQTNDICVSSSTLDLCPKSLQRLVQQSRRGLALGFKPALAPDGSGGSYFLSDARKKRVGVFKPADEEPFAENNPRGYVPHNTSSSTNPEDNTEWLRQGIRPGELCLREVAAFLLDHDGFSGVPMTTLAEARHPALHTAGAHWTLSEGGASVGVHSITTSHPSSPPTPQELIKKVGSFQEFIHAECTMDDLSPSKISVDEVHKIAILDIRLMNADRNVANILCQRIPEDPDHFRLVPIDHGYSLRSKCDVAWFDWCWLDWPQMKQPLSKKSKEYVLGLDIEADVRMLQERLNMQNDVLDYFRSSCLILKAGVRAGLTLHDICSEIMCRNDPSGEIPSKMETLTSMASELAMSAVHNGMFHHSTASMALEEQLATRRQSMMVSGNNQLSSRFPTPYKTRPVVRSASSSVFTPVASFGGESAFTDELSKVDSAFSSDFFRDSQSSANNNSHPPGMVQSSQSDNSFDADDDDVVSFTSENPEDSAAGEWAAALVAVADQSINVGHRDRSISESSESTSDSNDSSFSLSTSSSAVGFWYIRPGSSTIEDRSEDDDEPICWTPSLQSSSRNVTDDPPPLNIDKDGPPHILSPSGFSSSNLDKLLTVTSPDGESADDELGPMAPTPTTELPDGFKPLKQMNRSISYSAFSSASSKPNKLSQSTAVTRDRSFSCEEQSVYRNYFIKFVDLLVIRETERLCVTRAPGPETERRAHQDGKC